MSNLLILFLVFAVADQLEGLTKPTSVRLVNNGYTGVVFALHEDEPESEELIEALKIMITDASAYLYEATKHRAYFEEVMILIPDTWEDKSVYQSPKNATFEGADVIVAARNPRFAPTGSGVPKPHTKHYEGCGKRAVYIHLTKDFMLNEDVERYYGNRGRVLVHEWAHYRWGLFDEYPDPIGDPDFSENFYYSPTRGLWEPTRCTRGYTHFPVWFNPSIGRYLLCNGNETEGYQEGCVSIPAREQPGNITASIMTGTTNFEQIVDFCDDDHNEEAPNKHNRLCGGKSAWDVMRGHEDFKNTNLPREIQDTTPTFVLAKARGEIRLVLVLDSSGSMSTGNRIGKLASASRDFLLNIAVDGSYVGIVDFDSVGKRMSGLTLIDPRGTRSALANLIPTGADGGTCIGKGLGEAMEILSENGQSPEGGLILLMTDGEDWCDAETAEMGRRLVDASVVVNTVTISAAADPELYSLADATGGQPFHQTDDVGSTGLHDAFVGTMESGVKSQDRRIEIHRESSLYAPNEVRNHGVFLDATAGNRTAFEFAYYVASSYSVLEVTITSPSNTEYGRSYDGYTEDRVYNTISVKFETAEPGLWGFTVTNLYSSTHEVFSNVYTYPSQEGVDPIIATSELSGSTTDFAQGEPLIAFAEVVQGFYPVVRAKVTAIIERPHATPVEVELLDNGAGADITKDDGIYSRFFTDFTGIGFYGIRINIESTADTLIIDGTTTEPYSHTIPYFDPEALLRGEMPPPMGGEPVQLPGIPVPKITGDPSPQHDDSDNSAVQPGGRNTPRLGAWDDITPPSKIVDLRVRSSSYDNGTVSLEFTAPGDDLDNGSASFYVIRMSESKVELQTNYNYLPPVNESTIVFGDLSSPGPFGERQRFTLSVPVLEHESVVSYIFALHAVDETGNEGEISNLAQATLRQNIPPPATEPPPTTGEEPTTTSELPSTTVGDHMTTDELSLTTEGDYTISDESSSNTVGDLTGTTELSPTTQRDSTTAGEPSSTPNKPTKGSVEEVLPWLCGVMGLEGAVVVCLPLVVFLYHCLRRRKVEDEGSWKVRGPNRDVEGNFAYDNSTYM